MFERTLTCFRQGTGGRPAHFNATIKESSMSSNSNEDNVSVKQADSGTKSFDDTPIHRMNKCARLVKSKSKIKERWIV